MNEPTEIEGVLLLRWDAPLDGLGPTPREVAARVETMPANAGIVLLDLTHAPYLDGDGLRWLLRLRDALGASGWRLRIAARHGGALWRSLVTRDEELEIYGSVGRAWKASRKRRAGTP